MAAVARHPYCLAEPRLLYDAVKMLFIFGRYVTISAANAQESGTECGTYLHGVGL